MALQDFRGLTTFKLKYKCLSFWVRYHEELQLPGWVYLQFGRFRSRVVYGHVKMGGASNQATGTTCLCHNASGDTRLPKTGDPSLSWLPPPLSINCHHPFPSPLDPWVKLVHCNITEPTSPLEICFTRQEWCLWGEKKHLLCSYQANHTSEQDHSKYKHRVPDTSSLSASLPPSPRSHHLLCPYAQALEKVGRPHSSNRWGSFMGMDTMKNNAWPLPNWCATTSSLPCSPWRWPWQPSRFPMASKRTRWLPVTHGVILVSIWPNGVGCHFGLDSFKHFRAPHKSCDSMRRLWVSLLYISLI